MESNLWFEPRFEKVVDGLTGAEGPVFDRKGDFYMVAAEKGEIHRVDLHKKESVVVCKPVIDGVAGIPAGLQVDKENNLWVADMRLGLLKVDTTTGAWQQVTRTDSEGNPLQGCNDLIFDYAGNLWVTAPAGNIAPDEFVRSETDPFGAFYLYQNASMRKVDSGFLFSNGIAIYHDAGGVPRQVMVAETMRKTIWSYNVRSDGSGVDLESKTNWATLTDPPGPDGMDFDSRGNLLVAHFGAGSIDVFHRDNNNDAAGGSSSPRTPHTRIRCPFERVTNVHFQPGTKTVYVTEMDSGGLWRFEWKHKGVADYSHL